MLTQPRPPHRQHVDARHLLTHFARAIAGGTWSQTRARVVVESFARLVRRQLGFAPNLIGSARPAGIAPCGACVL